MEFKIPLRNRNKEIIDYTIVSEIDYEHLNKFSIFLSTSKYIEVSWSNATNKWVSAILYNKKPIYLGYFDDEIIAARDRYISTLIYFGENSKLNFL